MLFLSQEPHRLIAIESWGHVLGYRLCSLGLDISQSSLHLCRMERDPRLLDLKLAAKYPSNYSYPARKHAASYAQHFPCGSMGSEAGNPGLVPDHASDSDVEMDGEEDMAYHENTNQLWDTFWTPQSTHQDQPQRHKYPALMGFPAPHLAQRRRNAPPYQRAAPHIVSSSVESIDEPHAAPETMAANPGWPLPPAGLSPTWKPQHSLHTRQHSRPPKALCTMPSRLNPASELSSSLIPLSALPPRTTSLSRCGTPTPPSPPMRSAARMQKPGSLSPLPAQSPFVSHSAPVTPAVPTPASPADVSQPASCSNNRTRVNPHEPEKPSERFPPAGKTQRRPNSHALPKSVSTPDLKKQPRPRTAPAKDNGSRAPYYQEVTFLSSFPQSPKPSISPTVPSLASKSSTNLSIITSYMYDEVPPVPSLTSSFSSIGSSQNVSVWEDDSDDEDSAPRPTGLSRILNPGAHKRGTSKDHKRSSSRDGRESSLSQVPNEQKSAGRKRADTMLGRMLGRRSR